MYTTNTRIKQLRKALDLTQQAFADRLNVKRNTVATYETGKSKPSDAAVNLICREFHVNEEWLRTGSGEMFQPAPRDALDELIEQYGLPREVRSMLEKFLELKPDEQETVISYVKKVAADITAADFPAVWNQAAGESPDADPPPWSVRAADQPDQHVPPGYSSRAELEAEADEFAAMAREQFLSEKLPGYQASSVSESDGGPGGAA